jgi:predicted negative regulator of RcsB-dependent stress response
MYRKLQKDERGLTHLLYVVLIIVIVAVVGLVGWRVASNNKAKPATSSSAASSSSTTATTSASGSSCLATYHDATLCKFAANSNSFDKTAYTATLAITQSGTSSTMTL